MFLVYINFHGQLQSIIISPKYGNSWHNLLIVAKDEDTMYLSCYIDKTFHEHVTNSFQFFAHEFKTWTMFHYNLYNS